MGCKKHNASHESVTDVLHSSHESVTDVLHLFGKHCPELGLPKDVHTVLQTCGYVQVQNMAG